MLQGWSLHWSVSGYSLVRWDVDKMKLLLMMVNKPGRELERIKFSLSILSSLFSLPWVFPFSIIPCIQLGLLIIYYRGDLGIFRVTDL